VKNIFFISVSLLLSFIVSEIIISFFCGYPKYGVKCYVQGLDYRNWDKSRIYKPYSEYMVVEGENKGRVFKRNNNGFPGTNLIRTTKSKNIAVLGSSFIEAQQVYPEQIATSVLQHKLRKSYGDVNVVNIGYRGGNPLNIFRRLKYWDNIFAFDLVVLVLDHYPYQGLSSDVQTMAKIPDKWVQDNRIEVETYRLARNTSSLINLLIPGLLVAERPTDKIRKMERTMQHIDYQPLEETFKLYSNERSRLLIVSIATINDGDKNEYESKLVKLGALYNIPVFLSDDFGAHFKIHGGGHFNEIGNAHLASILFQAIRTVSDKDLQRERNTDKSFVYFNQ